MEVVIFDGVNPHKARCDDLYVVFETDFKGPWVEDLQPVGPCTSRGIREAEIELSLIDGCFLLTKAPKINKTHSCSSFRSESSAL